MVAGPAIARHENTAVKTIHFRMLIFLRLRHK
jgi:hypothetical protein